MENIINLEKNILENAKISACRINDKETRIKSYALNIAANITAQYLTKMGLDADTSLSLYKIPTFQENFELADVYVKGFRFDVRISFDGVNYTVPKIHAKYGATPLAYIVIKLDENLKNAEFLGFLPTENVTYPESNNEYHTLLVSDLKPIEEIKELLENSTLNIHPYSPNNHEKIKELSTSFIDGEITDSEKVFFIKHIIACPVCRETFCDVNDFDTIVSQIRNYQELLNDSTLSVLSGNKKEIDEAALANLAFVENAEENLVDEIPSNIEFLDEDIKTETIMELVDDSSNVGLIEEATETLDAGLAELDTVEEITEELPIQEVAEEVKDVDLIEEEEESSLELTDELPHFEEVEEFNIHEEKSEEILIEETTETLDAGLAELDTIEEITEELPIQEVAEESKTPFAGIELVEDDVDDIGLGDSENETPETIELLDESKQTQQKHKIFGFETDSLDRIEELIDSEEKSASSDGLIMDSDEDTELANPNEIGVVDTYEELNEMDNLDTDSSLQSNYSPQKPVELVYDEEEAVADSTVMPEIKHNNDDEVQSLLDDDLMALLAEDENPESSESNEEQIVQNSENVEGNDEAEKQENALPDENIESLFDNEQSNGEPVEFKLAEEPITQETVKRTKNVAIVAGLMVVLLGVGSGLFVINKNKAVNTDDIMQENEMFDTTTAQNNAVQSPAVSQDINRSMTNSFSDKPAAITVTKLSWQINEKLAIEPSVKEYLQTAGRNIQMNLQSDLANSADIAFNNLVKVSFVIAPDNTLKSIQILESSGSDDIDARIKSSLKNTLNYVSVPKLKDFNSDYFLTLIINF